MVLGALMGRDERPSRVESMPLDGMREPPLALKTFLTMSAALAVGLGGREAVDDRVDRRPGPVGAEGPSLFRLFPRPTPFAARDGSMTRSPSLSTLVRPPSRRLLMPRPVDLAFALLFRVGRVFRGPVGGAIVVFRRSRPEVGMRMAMPVSRESARVL